MANLDRDLGGLVDPAVDRPARLLIVDDQPINIQVLYRLFADRHQVFMATEGEAALQIARHEQPDLILLDWVMPGLNGHDLCKALKASAETRDIPVLFVTAQQDPEQETRALDVGGVDFITKPINPAAVRARVRTHLTLKFQTDLLKRMAFIDGLTGIFNRRYLDDRLSTEWHRAARHQSSLGVVLLDVDHFKLYNDHRGHQAGDECLRTVAACLRQTLKRPGDVVTRYGGEEFACVLPDTALDGARLVAHKLVQAVSELRLPHGHSPVSDVVTASAGVAVARPQPTDGMAGLQQLLAAADAGLYQAKHLGRAQVAVAPST